MAGEPRHPHIPGQNDRDKRPETKTGVQMLKIISIWVIALALAISAQTGFTVSTTQAAVDTTARLQGTIVIDYDQGTGKGRMEFLVKDDLISITKRTFSNCDVMKLLKKKQDLAYDVDDDGNATITGPYKVRCRSVYTYVLAITIQPDGEISGTMTDKKGGKIYDFSGKVVKWGNE